MSSWLGHKRTFNKNRVTPTMCSKMRFDNNIPVIGDVSKYQHNLINLSWRYCAIYPYLFAF